MNFQELLQNKKLVIAIIAGIVVILAVFITLGIVASSKSSSGAPKVVAEKIIKEPLDLLTTDNIGKAIEIQALLAREGITVLRKLDGTKSTLFLKNYRMSERDRALLAIVQSGLMDQNMGLEIFDKGDFTSTKEDKRIRLARAINGELSRLIRRIEPIESASVFISIPEQSLFTENQKPITATVQITIPSGEKLEQLKVKAIRNLILGSVSGITSDNVTISDTNGNVYSTIVDADDDTLAKIEENDRYMQKKVQAQLDKLVGKGNYVATVSTFLRQAPVEKFSILYDPKSKTSMVEQSFAEGLGDQTKEANKGINAVSVYLPNGLPGGGSDTSQDRSYSRTARETQYGVSKTQVNEYIKPGVIEEISIAVTLDQNAVPATISIEELKELLARAASPKALAENVSIAFSDSTEPFLASDKPVSLPKPDETGNPWWIVVALFVIGLCGGLTVISNKVKMAQKKQKEELEKLEQKAQEQEKQLRDVNLKAAELIERQSQLAQGLIEQQNYVQSIPQQMQAQQMQTQPMPQQQYQPMPAQQTYNQNDYEETVDELSADMAEIDSDEAIEHLKSWIET
ncbi:hypothetical protein J6Q66_08350 [bacterium]|nr:hypothetical protein [bacterium]